ncbi:septum formation initiator family protein [Candidatus Uhrbacteria bacterium]|nr:septum formation initiator family protein [Candidatus Uhrbacteria bacterium]
MIRKPNQNSRSRWWLAGRGLFLANLAVLALVAWGFSGEYFRHRRLKSELSRLEAEAVRLETENSETVELGRRFAADEAVEREARTKLGLRKPGESVIILKGTGAVPVSSGGEAAASVPGDSEDGKLRLWWKYFFNY